MPGLTGAFKASYFDGHSSKARALRLSPSQAGLKFLRGGPPQLAWSQVEIEEEGPGRIRLQFLGGAYALLEGPEAAAWAGAGWGDGRPWYRKPGLRKAALATFASFCLVSTAVFGFGWGLDPILDACMRRLPPALEKRLGDKLRKAMLDDAPLAGAREAKILDRLARQLPGFDAGSAPHILLINDATVNAFALPDGSIVLHRGLLQRLKRQDELIAVIGHEAGHLRRRHALRRLVRASLVGISVSMLLGDASGASASLLDSGRNLAELSFSRKDEREADDDSIATLQALGLDPGAAARVMQRLLEEHLEKGFKVPEFLSTHPGDKERLLRLQEMAAGLPPGNRKLLTDREWLFLQRSGGKAGKP